MIRKVLPYILLASAGIAAAILIFRIGGRSEAPPENHALKLIPEDAVWIMESASAPDLLRTLTKADPLFPILGLNQAFEPFLSAVRKADSVLSARSGFRRAFSGCPAVVSLHQTGRILYQFLLVFNLGGAGAMPDPQELFAALGGDGLQWTDREYNGQTIRRYSFGEKSMFPGISMMHNRKYWIISPSPVLVENAIRLLEQESGFGAGPVFARLSGTAGKESIAHIYINLKTLPRWLGTWMNSTAFGKFEDYNRYGEWAEMDLTLRNDAAWLNGFALAGDTLNSYLNVFRNQLPLKLEAERFLPSNTAAYFTQGIEKTETYLNDLSDYLAGSSNGRERQKLISQASRTAGEDVLVAWKKLDFIEITIGYLYYAADESVKPAVLVSVQNRTDVEEKLGQWLGKSSVDKPERLRKAGRELNLSPPGEVPVYQTPFVGLPFILGGGMFSQVNGKYFGFSGNMLILADDPQIIRNIVRYQENNRILATDAYYLSLTDLISTRANMMFFAVPDKSRPLLARLLSQKVSASLLGNDRFFRKTGAFCLQFHCREGMFYHNMFTRFGDVIYNRPQTIWESKLDSRVAMKPVIVTNHLTKAREIMLQDESNALYLLSESGKILWKKPIDGKIMSGIDQVDAMKNGKLQYLFSTETQLHLLDRTGNYLAGYPVKLRSPASNGMALADPDKNRDYRILIAGTDNLVYSFDKTGRPTKGWAPVKTGSPVTRPVQYFKIQNKDYFVFTNDLKVYLVDRKGVAKVKPDRDFPVSQNGMLIYDATPADRGGRFLITDMEGGICSVYLNGEVEITRLDAFSKDHFFLYEDINQDGLREYIFTERNRLEVFTSSGDKLFSKRFSGMVGFPPEVMPISGGGREIGLVFPDRDEIYLVDSQGDNHTGFPLSGSSPFTNMPGDPGAAYFNLLTGSKDGFLYNYAIK